jgi:NAD+ kinase
MVFGIRGNITKAELPGIVKGIIHSMDKQKIAYVIDKKLASVIYKKYGKKISPKSVAADARLPSLSDFIVSIGGDGTFLETAKLVGNKNIPIIGVNLGKLGFLAEASVEKISDFITDVTHGKYKIEERTTISANSAAAGSKLIYGLNEIVINQTTIVKTILIEIYFNKQLVFSYHGDGLIVATPTGSTGYSLSAGGPIVNPDSNVIIISPLSPHTLTARPIIVPDNGSISVKVKSKVPIIVTADGNSSFILKNPAAIEIKKAPYKIKIAKSIDSNYFKILNQKLYWGADKRNT